MQRELRLVLLAGRRRIAVRAGARGIRSIVAHATTLARARRACAAGTGEGSGAHAGPLATGRVVQPSNSTFPRHAMPGLGTWGSSFSPARTYMP
ncbi:hypothetical protein GCM10009819_18010 [Agromyces tropicus]|uniref:Uncharacterized protein n=1 Tax=Agromyces tropicus TaxID=555371 RepID=A0ABP5FUA0_9MICO